MRNLIPTFDEFIDTPLNGRPWHAIGPGFHQSVSTDIPLQHRVYTSDEIADLFDANHLEKSINFIGPEIQIVGNDSYLVQRIRGSISETVV